MTVHIAVTQPFLSRSWAKMVENWDFVTVACHCEKAAGQPTLCLKCVMNPVYTVPRTGGGPRDVVLTSTLARTLCTHANVLNAGPRRKPVRFLLQKLQKLQYSQLYRLIAQASTHLLGTPPVGDLVTSSDRLGPVETSNGRIAVLARRPAENGDVFCDFVASRGCEGPPSILATPDKIIT